MQKQEFEQKKRNENGCSVRVVEFGKIFVGEVESITGFLGCGRKSKREDDR